MAKRQRFLTESEISKIMNEPDTELSSDESINSLCFTDSNYSEMAEEYDVNDPINAPRVSEWNSNISDLPNLNFSSDCGAKINSSNPLEKEVDYFNLFFSQDIIDLIVEQTNKFAAFELEKDAQKPSTSSAKSKSFANITINELRVFFCFSTAYEHNKETFNQVIFFDKSDVCNSILQQCDGKKSLFSYFTIFTFFRHWI